MLQQSYKSDISTLPDMNYWDLKSIIDLVDDVKV